MRIYGGENFDLVKEIDFHGMWITWLLIPQLTGCTWDLAKTRRGDRHSGRDIERALPEDTNLARHPGSFQPGNRWAEHLCESVGLEADCGIIGNRGDYAVADDAEHNFPMALDERITGCCGDATSGAHGRF